MVYTAVGCLGISALCDLIKEVSNSVLKIHLLIFTTCNATGCVAVIFVLFFK